MDILLNKVKSLLKLSGNGNDTTSATPDSGKEKDTEKEIDLQKLFSSQGIDILPVIKKILNLETDFPDNILKSSRGHKYNELEFFKSNLDSNISSDVESLFQKLDKTQTQLGHYLFQNILLNPLNKKHEIQNILMNRQLVIQNLTKNNYPKNKVITNKVITNIISNIKTLENDLLAMLLPDTPEMKEVYNLIYFEIAPLRGLNYNEIFMKVFYYFIIKNIIIFTNTNIRCYFLN